MSKHTPGPWVIRETPTHISVVGENNECLFHDNKRIPCVIEDARLIAAAPGMLDMLKECRAALASIFVYGVPEGMVDRVNALIQKAEGNDA